ncbi:MAG: recombination protein RecR [Fimbriimonadales bacterium]
MLLPRSLSTLIGELEKLPGVGPKSAQRLAFHLLRVPEGEAERLAEAILAARRNIRFCRRCFNVADEEYCPVCSDPRRDASSVCVVSEVRDVIAIERTNEFRGRYHVLHGVISPAEGVTSEQLHLKELAERVAAEGVSEVIVATNPTLEGDATALYIAKLVKPLGVRVSRLAHGMPVGGDLDYADQATLVSALQWRRDL